jgi:AmmeMemoRadiSam system protein B
MWLLRDPLELTEYQLVLPPALAQMLIFCDGTRDVTEIQAAFSEFIGMPVARDIVVDTLAQLDEACLLDNERSRQLMQAQLHSFRSLGYRPPALAGVSYPADPADLDRVLTIYGRDDELDGWRPWTGRGIISPHIDYQRGGPVYAQVWRRAQQAVEQADLVLIFGTDHNGGPGSVTLTRLPYASPYGVIPTDEALVDKLAEALGPQAFDEELHHRKEHSVELSAVWMHHVSGGNACPMVPILCGSFHHFVTNGHHPDEDDRLSGFIETLRAETAGRKVLAVASVDLAHVGPNFGDSFVMDPDRRNQLKISDANLIQAISHGDASRFYQEIAAVEDRNRICGLSSIYLLLRFLGPSHGQQIAYEHCPADSQDTSLVSICGLLLD